MAYSGSEDEGLGLDDADFDRPSEEDDDIDDDILDALEDDLAAEAAAEEATEAEEDSPSDDSTLSPTSLARALSPASLRRAALTTSLGHPRSYTVEAICAIPHPVPTHSLAASACMTHLLTGSDDGYVRDYDIFSAVNGKFFLTAPQRHHCGVMEGLMKAGQIRCWWENPAPPDAAAPPEEPVLCPVYSLAMHSDALWALAGSDRGHINLFTVRHDPGRLIHVMPGHRGRPVSGISLQHDEMGFFSAGWDGSALQWDLNTGQCVRNFTAHGAQLTAIAVRPVVRQYDGHHWSSPTLRGQHLVPEFGQAVQTSGARALPDVSYKMEDDTRSEMSYDPLFDEPDADGEPDEQPQKPTQPSAPRLAFPGAHAQETGRSAPAPRNAPPVLDSTMYGAFSPDVLMTASIDGQVFIWDTRVNAPGYGVGRLWMSEKTPPWCVSACWSADGAQVYAGRRNGTVDVWDVRQTGRPGTPRILKTLRNPVSSGVVSCVVAFPDGKHLACASNDNIRLWNVAEAGEPDASGKMKSGVQFKIIPGHHGGFISQMLVDPAARFLVTASSNRGWHGESTRTIFVHEIKHIR
ncbi:WD40-repeat-containing domain protein [Fomitopsis serialis]|uniref:WD40-repeat-containing domain protein n=1 Tax=Fomitopsis serialis TaxID=139415 RepID=UPI002007B5B4|nr:WD40-repeat-containing domain protein [Neoantrodia serialis]KAH9935015.1 WD40-repeat-containing domain protein [Neoantrodia serialis]